MASPLRLSELTNSWVHSHEEDTPTGKVYRPADYPFPPSRGRSGFALLPDGTLLEAGPGPVDRIEKKKGVWNLRDQTLQLKEEGSGTREIKIESLEPGRLIIEK